MYKLGIISRKYKIPFLKMIIININWVYDLENVQMIQKSVHLMVIQYEMHEIDELVRMKDYLI